MCHSYELLVVREYETNRCQTRSAGTQRAHDTWLHNTFWFIHALTSLLLNAASSALLLRVFAGEAAPAQCTLAYAPPEMVAAYQRGAQLVAHPSQDVWAVGVMVRVLQYLPALLFLFVLVCVREP
jgi:hypothetical protein